jgi:enoyl-CoA hydratase/carnithine racemase
MFFTRSGKIIDKEEKMSKVVIESHENVALVRLNNGVINAINTELVDDLSQAIHQVKTEFKGMVLAGGTKFFCIGLDLPVLLKLDRAGMSKFWDKFDQVIADLYTLPIPTACAVAGHAVAGGTILALSCDYRFVASGRKYLGLNEIKIGVPVPYLPDLILRQIVGDRAATEVVYRGEMIEPQAALEIGLIDEVFSEDDLEEQAVGRITELAVLSQPAFGFIKENRVRDNHHKFVIERESNKEQFLDCWFQESVRELLGEAAKKF